MSRRAEKQRIEDQKKSITADEYNSKKEKRIAKTKAFRPSHRLIS
jgi:hypothetical protein